MSKEKYRIIRGTLTTKDIHLPLRFGLVYETNGVYSADLYIEGDSNLQELFDNFDYRQDLKLTGNTEDGYKIEIYGLYVTKIEFDSRKISLDCLDYLAHTKLWPWEEEPDLVTPNPIHYLEIEGLAMEFSDFTQHKQLRNNSSKEIGKAVDRDHSTAELRIDSVPYNMLFRKDHYSDNIIVEFSSDSGDIFTFEKFREIKHDFISFLALLNGASVKIRKEYTGKSVVYSFDDELLSSDIVITYSFERIKNSSYNNYIPLNKRLRNVPENIISRAFLFSFEKFRDWNKKIDLSSIINYLNSSQKLNIAQEKFFIEIIAFERLTTLYAECKDELDGHVPNQLDYIPIKKQFIDLLERYKAEFATNYEKARSILGNLNEVKRLSTKDKMYGLLSDLKIVLDDDIRDLINIIRNSAVHKGHIGHGSDAIKYLMLLNELLYEIILRLIDYRSVRLNQYLLERNLNMPYHA